MKIYNLFSPLPICLFLCFACKTQKINYESETYSVLENQLKVKMRYLRAEESEKTVLIVPSPYSYFNRKPENALSEWLHKQNYHIVIAPTHEDIPLLTKEKWTKGIMDGFYRLISDSLIPLTSEELIIIGLEEGAHVLPELCKLLKPNVFIAVNSGPESPLKELLTALADTTANLEPFIEAYDAIDAEELREKSGKLLDGTLMNTQLGARSNPYWLSFYENPTYKSLLLGRTRGYYILYKDYGLINNTGVMLLEKALPKEPSRKVELIQIPGKGQLKKEEDMKQLINQLKPIFNNLR